MSLQFIGEFMSHLTTIIKRVYRGARYKSYEKDYLFLQSVANLKEYKKYQDDYTELERYIAEKLYKKYSRHLKGTIYENILDNSI